MPIELTPVRVICDLHGELFREKWPSGYAAFSIESLQCLMNTEEFYNDCRKLATAPDDPIEDTIVMEALDIRPICYRLPTAKLIEMYEFANANNPIWFGGKCDLCKELRRVVVPLPLHDEYGIRIRAKLCLKCICEKLPKYQRIWQNFKQN